MDLEQFLRIIRNMEPMPGSEFKPHRYLALLATMDIIHNQENPENTFFYDDDFKSHFTHYFNICHGPNDRNKPFKPFFHLKNAGGFWFLIHRPGREADLNSMRGGFSERELRENVEYAKLDEKLFGLLSDKESGQESREIVRNVIKQCLKAGLRTDC
jgi:predicted restriction endonuclease